MYYLAKQMTKLKQKCSYYFCPLKKTTKVNSLYENAWVHVKRCKQRPLSFTT